MNVDRAGTQLAPAGIGKHGFPGPGQDRAEKDHRRAHLAHQCVGNLESVHRSGVHHQVIFFPVRPAAQMAQYRNGGVHIAQTRTMLDPAGVRTQQRRRQHGQDAVFCALYLQFAVQAVSALDDQLTHRVSLRIP